MARAASKPRVQEPEARPEPTQDAAPQPQRHVVLVAEKPEPKAHPRLSELLAEAIGRETDVARRAALDAIYTALYDLQRRACSVDEHLRADYAPLLRRIEAL